MVMFPGSETPVAIQVYPTAEPMERAHQVLLGTDNLDMLGAAIDRNEKCTTYKRVPGRRKPVQSMHLNSTAAQRQFIAHRVGCDEAQVPHDPRQGAVPGDKRGRSEGVDPEDRRWKSQECLVEEVVAENRGRYHARYCDAQEVTAELDEAEVGNIEKHMRKIERAVSKGDKALARARFLKLVTLEQDADAEFGLLERAATLQRTRQRLVKAKWRW
jgi:hypothetical protein